MAVTKKQIAEALGNIGFMCGYEYKTRKTIIVNGHVWDKAISALDKSGIPYKVLRVASSSCTGEISFKPE